MNSTHGGFHYSISNTPRTIISCFLLLTISYILQQLINGIHDELLTNLNHFNDENLIYKLIFADVSKGNRSKPYAL